MHGNSKWLNPVSQTRPTYESWSNMRRRCLDPQNPDYPYYGGRGITICDRWVENYDAFVEDMGLKPDRGHTLERQDNSGGYSKKNCTWATRKQQSRNKRNNHIVVINGVGKTIADWADESGVSCRALWLRLQREDISDNILRQVQKPQGCGTRGKYRRGCRCEGCVEANRAYKREQHAKRKR